MVDNPDEERFELRLGEDLVGVLEYRGGGEDRAITHTEIFEGHEGEGLGGHLVGAALDDLRDRGIRIFPVCPYVRRFLEKHREYLDLIDPQLRAGLGL